MQIDTVVSADVRRQELPLKQTQVMPNNLKEQRDVLGDVSTAMLTANSAIPLMDKENTAEQKDPKSMADSINKTLEKINNFVPIANTNLVFEFDDISDPPIIKVIDKETKELIREIPSQEIENVAKAFSELADKMNKSGLLLNMEA